jgi:hypothetical protein
MSYLKTAAGALAIITASGMIADYDVGEFNDTIYVRIWSMDDQSDARLRKQVAAMLPVSIGESRVFVVRDGVIST